VQEGVVGLKWVGDRGSVDAERGWEVGSAGEAKEGFRLTGGGMQKWGGRPIISG